MSGDMSGVVLNPNRSRWREFLRGIEAKRVKDNFWRLQNDKMERFWGYERRETRKREPLLDVFSYHIVNADNEKVSTHKRSSVPEAKPLAPFKIDVMWKGMNCD